MELGVSITRSATETYEFLSVPENFAKWRWGAGASLRPAGADWIAHIAEGQVTVCLSDRNSRGVLDYAVTRPSGVRVYVPLRVVPNGRGCDLVLTLFRPDRSDENFASLLAAKRILEAR